MESSLRVPDILIRKRDGLALSPGQMRHIVLGYSQGDVPDYQMSAFLMAVTLRGLSQEETIELTRCMIDSGQTVTFPNLGRPTVDKHSTGGVGDKTTLVLAPLLASLGLAVPKLSGRGLGHTGGTLDKLESIPGFRTNLTLEEFHTVVSEIGVAIMGAAAELVPADQKMYALRDVTGTVDSPALIASSIMSKKLAIVTDALVLDVKVGQGAFFATVDAASEFAKTAQAISNAFGRRTAFVLTDMEQPLGFAVGNALEVREAIETVHGHGPSDLLDVCAVLALQLMQSIMPQVSVEEARDRIRRAIQSGDALRTFCTWIAHQGGDPDIVNKQDGLPWSRRQETVRSTQSGYVTGINCRSLGHIAQVLGAGRTRKEDTVDPAAGLVLHVKHGSRVQVGDDLATLHTNLIGSLDKSREALLDAIQIAGEIPAERPIILGVIENKDSDP